MTLGIVLAEDNLLAREGLRSLLATEADLDLLAVCEDYDQLMTAVDEHGPDVVLTDIRMPPSFTDEGVRAANLIRGSHPDTGVVVISQYDDPEFALALLDHGSEGRAYLLKERIADPAELRTAIEVVARGGSLMDPEMVQALMSAAGRGDSPLSRLTGRELEVLGQMAEGKSNGAIAESLVLSKRAVEKHVGAIFLRLGLADEEVVSRRVTAVLLYLGDRDERVA